MSVPSFENIHELLHHRVEQSPDKEFLFDYAEGRVFTYREFEREVERAAELLISLGARRGERVSLFLTNSVEYFICYFACFRTGAWAGPVNALLKSQEIEFVINDSGATIAVTQPDLLPRLEEARKRLPALLHVVVVGSGQWAVGSDQGTGVRGQGSLIGDQSDERRANDESAGDESKVKEANQPPTAHRPLPTDEAVIIYTSGTTGKPKGVLLTHGNMLANAQQIAEWLRLTERDRALMIMPLFHVNALMTTGLAALWAGGSVVLAPRFTASHHWEIVERYKVTYFGSVATMLSMLINSYPKGVLQGTDISSLRFALCGSAPVPVEVMKRFESLFGFPVIEGYGLSESTCRSTFNPIDDRRRIGSVGLPIGNEMKVFDDKDRELPAGEIGEIVLRGSNVMKGYYRNESATREAFRSGWFHTGDLGYCDEDGFFYIVDRKGDMIIRAGENIYPREIDEALYQHPAVKDAATIGIPDPLYGEEVKSFVVLKVGVHATEEEIIAFCRERLADFKCPRRVEFLSEIPKGPTGKLLKRELAALHNK
ncbi:MAG TPA: long-chain-fatty-acid--CoA ligase [Blastocatellia bacterium]